MSKKKNVIQPIQSNFKLFNLTILNSHSQIFKKWLVGLDRLSNKKAIYEMTQSELNRKAFKDLLIKYIRNTNNEE